MLVRITPAHASQYSNSDAIIMVEAVHRVGVDAALNTPGLFMCPPVSRSACTSLAVQRVTAGEGRDAVAAQTMSSMQL